MNDPVKLVETHADHRRGPSDDLLVACRAGYLPALSWLVTKEDGSQAMVVLLWRQQPALREPDPPRGWPSDPVDLGRYGYRPGAVVGTAIVAVSVMIAILAVVLSSRA